MRKLSAKWVLKCLNADQKSQRCHSSEKFWIFFGAIQRISCRDWWSWTKPRYITMTRRENNNHWSSGIAAHPAPKNSECKNPLEKFSPRFFGIKTASPSLIIFQRAKLSTRSIAHLCWCNWRTFWRKNAGGSLPMVSCSCTTMCRLTGHLQPKRIQKKLAYLGFQYFDYPPYSPDLAPFELPPVSWIEKDNWKVAIFRPTRRSLLPRRPGWTDKFLNFLSRLQKLEQRAKKRIELRGEYVENPEFGRCSLFPSWPG